MPNPLLNCTFRQVPCNLFPVLEGRAQITPAIIVLHYLHDTMDAVAIAQATTSKRLSKGKFVEGYHFLVDVTGFSAQLVDMEDSVPNLYQILNPTIPLPVTGATGVDSALFHIGLTGMDLPCQTFTEAQYWELVRVICCITNNYPDIIPSATTVVLPTAINASQTNLEYYDESFIPDTLYADAIACVSREAALPFVNYPFPQDTGTGATATTGCNEVLTECCETNTADIVLLKQRLTVLEALVATLNDGVQTALANYQALVDQVKATNTYLASIKTCLACLCPADVAEGAIEYILQGVAQYQTVLPNINRWINFASKVTDLTPEIVQAGPLWTIDLPGGTHAAEVEVKFSSAEYCAGCKVWLEMVQCGVRTRITEQTLTSGLQSVTITWSGDITITTPCPDLHFEVGTDSTIGTPATKTIEYARFKCTV